MEFPEGCSQLGDGERFSMGKASYVIRRAKAGAGRQAGEKCAWDGLLLVPAGAICDGRLENETGRHADEAQREVVWLMGFGWRSTNVRARYGEVVGIVRQIVTSCIRSTWSANQRTRATWRFAR